MAITRTLSVTPLYPTLEDQGDIDGTVAEGLRSFEQRVVQKLRFWQGTWFRDTTKGTRYNSVFGEFSTRDVAAQALRTAVLEVTDCTGATVTITEYNLSRRHLVADITASCEEGDVQLGGLELNG